MLGRTPWASLQGGALQGPGRETGRDTQQEFRV